MLVSPASGISGNGLEKLITSSVTDFIPVPLSSGYMFFNIADIYLLIAIGLALKIIFSSISITNQHTD